MISQGWCQEKYEKKTDNHYAVKEYWLLTLVFKTFHSVLTTILLPPHTQGFPSTGFQWYWGRKGGRCQQKSEVQGPNLSYSKEPILVEEEKENSRERLAEKNFWSFSFHLWLPSICLHLLHQCILCFIMQTNHWEILLKPRFGYSKSVQRSCISIKLPPRPMWKTVDNLE